MSTRAARSRAAEADVVVHDALVGDGVLALVAPHVELIDVGKRPGRGTAQDLINLLLVELAAQGHAPDAVVLPKVECAAEVELVARHLRATGPVGAAVEAMPSSCPTAGELPASPSRANTARSSG